MPASQKLLIAGWAAGCAGVAAVVLVCMRWLDIPIANAFSENMMRTAIITKSQDSPILIAVDCILLLGLVIWRFIGEPLAPMTKTFLLAGAIALCMLMVNDLILKVLFGVPTPYRYMMGGKAHSFHWLAGSDKSSFPSGHLSMAASFAAVFVRKYPKTIPLFALALAAAAAALIIGDWHFISDVIAGAFIGYVTGTLAAAFWLERLARAK